MKIVSWNVNGLRACLKKGFLDFVAEEQPDILCIQETKMQEGQVELELSEYDQYWNSAEKKGYSGTAIFTKQSPTNCSKGIGVSHHDNEGRVLTLEYSRFYLVNTYTPNAQRGLTRLDYRMDWDRDYLHYLKELERSKPVIFCGDLNVAHKEIDLANPKSNRRNAGFTDEERSGLTNLVESGFLDTFRLFNKEPGHYTWWSYMFNARAKNIGWRIDYFCCSDSLKSSIESSYILPAILGSDHCPIALIIQDQMIH